MHGLNTNQIVVAPIPFQIFNSNGGSPTATINYVVECDRPSIQRQLLNNPPSNDEQYWWKRLYSSYMFANNGQYPVIFEKYWLTCRKDVPVTEAGSFNDFIGNSEVSPFLPYISPLTDNKTLKFFKINKSTRKILYPTRITKVMVKATIRNKYVTTETEMDPNITFRRGNKLCFIRMYGSPQGFISTSGLASYPSPIAISCIGKHYGSYYRLDDVDPTQNYSSAIPTTYVPGGQYYFNSTLAAAVAENTGPFGAAPIYVQST